MGALTIIPAAVAKNISRSMRGYIVVSAMLGGAVSVGGMWIADEFSLLPGPSIVLFGVGLFLLSLVAGRRRVV
jgi:ABC-type Mn2+/Zn2+ transport system permease subunit